MREYKDVEVPAHTARQMVATLCDLCRAPVGFPPQFGGPFASDEVTVSRVEHEGYDPFEYVKSEFDLCGRCFASKLVPWMASHGAHPTVTKGNG